MSGLYASVFVATTSHACKTNMSELLIVENNQYSCGGPVVGWCLCKVRNI
jgi:hypothetical protein